MHSGSAAHDTVRRGSLVKVGASANLRCGLSAQGWQRRSDTA